MKTMMKTLVMTILVAVSGSVCAQSRMTEEQKAEAKAKYEEYRKRLNLTDEQSEKVEEINLVFFEGLAELKNSDESRLSKYKKFKKLKSEKDGEMKKVLDDEQYKIYAEFQAEMKEEFMENRRKNKG